MKNLLRKALAIATVSAMTISLAACGGGSAATEEASSDAAATEAEDPAFDAGTPVSGGTFSTYWSEFYNEYDVSANDNRNFVDLFSESLWGINWDNREELGFKTAYLDINYITGNLAKEWEMADDYSSLTVTLQDGVTFADKTAVGIDEEYDIYGGRALTAADVKYSYDRVMGFDGVTQVQMEQTDWPGSLSMLESVEALDDSTVKFNFNTNTELDIQKFMCVMLNICGPEWDELTDEQKTNWHYAGGTGAFILTNYVNDNTMTFTANPSYWATDADGNALPYLSEINLVHTLDAATMTSSIIGGELQALVANNELISADEASTLPDTVNTYSYYNDCPAVCIKLGDNPVEALTDINVRKAMQYAIDLEAISEYKGYTYADDLEKNINLFLNGTGLNTADGCSEETLAEYTTYDPELAQQLLDEAGYGDGFEFDVYLYEAQPIDSFQLAAEYLSKVNITMNINVCSTPPEMSAHGADRTDPASMYGSIGTDKTNAIINIFRSDGVMNNVFQTNDAIDDWCDQISGAATLEDMVAAAAGLSEEYLSQHYYMLVSYAQQYNNYASDSLKGWNGEKWTQYYFAGDILSRIWVE
ncbi:MAG: ABC transporter substrate-binding protein [Eubacterium sp.]|nr:ABC transporter substrate-binding protein [Eubacterium sp.]